MSRLRITDEIYSVLLEKLYANKVIHRREREESIQRGSTQYRIVTDNVNSTTVNVLEQA